MTTEHRGDAAGETLKPCPFCGSVEIFVEEMGTRCKGCGCFGPMRDENGESGHMKPLIARAAWNRRAIPGRAATEDEVERVARAMRAENYGTESPGTVIELGWVRLARAALAEMRGGEHPYDRALAGHEYLDSIDVPRDDHMGELTLVGRMQTLQKQLAEREARVKELEAKVKAMYDDDAALIVNHDLKERAERAEAERDEARRRLVELERAEEVRDAVCEERNMLAKRVGELEAALTETCALVSAEYCSHAGDCGPDNRACYVREALAVLGKRGVGTMNTAYGEARG